MITLVVLTLVVVLAAATGFFALRGGDLARRDFPAVTNQETRETGADQADALNDPSRWW